MKIGIAGFPPDTTEEEISQALKDFGVPVTHVAIEPSKDQDRFLAVVEAEVDEAGARVLVDLINNKVWKGKTLRANRYLMFD